MSEHFSAWRKSSRSTQQQNNCVETRLHDGQCQVRDSKLGDDSPILNLSAADFTGLLDTINEPSSRT